MGSRLALVFAASMLASMLFMASGAEAIELNCNPPASGRWTISSNVICENRIIRITPDANDNGGVLIEPGGKLFIKDVDLMIESPSANQQIEVKSGGEIHITDSDNNALTLTDRSVISSGTPEKNYMFSVYGRIVMNNSEMRDAGWSWPTYTGLIISGANAEAAIKDNRFVNNKVHIGITDVDSSSITIENNDMTLSTQGEASSLRLGNAGVVVSNSSSQNIRITRNRIDKIFLYSNYSLPAYGILVAYSQNTQIDSNSIKDFDASGIDLVSSSNILAKNNIIDNMAKSAAQKTGICIRPRAASYNNIFQNNTIKNCQYGIRAIESSYGITADANKITENAYGISFTSGTRDSFILNNNILDNTEGIDLTDGKGQTVRNNTIKNVLEDGSTHLMLTNTTNSYFIRNLLSNLATDSVTGIYLVRNSDNNRFVYNIIKSSALGSYAVNARENSTNNYFINTTFDKSRVLFGDSLSSIEIAWYLDVKTIRKDSTPVDGVAVSITDVNSNQIFSGLSDQNGRIPTQNATEYTENSGGRTYRANYTAIINLAGQSNSTQTSLEKSRLIKLTVPPSECRALTGSYKLINDVWIANAVCFSAEADSLTLDCNGYRITGTNGVYGVRIENHNSVTVKNCDIDGFSAGIRLVNARNSRMLNNSIHGDSWIGDGIYISDSSSNNVIERNTITSASSSGIYITANSRKNNVTRTTLASNEYGIKLSGSFSNNLIDSIIGQSASAGIGFSGEANLTALNSSFASVSFTAYKQNLTRKWRMFVYVVNDQFFSIPSAYVSVKNVSGDVVFSGTTNQDGLLPVLHPVQYTENYRGKTYQTQYTVYASKNDQDGNPVENNAATDLTEDTYVYVTLNLPGIACPEGAKRECGPSTEQGVCRKGMSTCANGEWGPCEGAVYSAAEICGNGLDEDCNGSDAPCSPSSNGGGGGGGGAPKACPEYATRECGIENGSCKKGMQTCVNGNWSVCMGGVGPKEEICNGLDDDCNGVVDDMMILDARGTSVEATLCQCYGGGEPVAETCNGIDDDCSGIIDDNAGCCIPGETRECGSSAGVCIEGVSTCSDNSLWGDCIGAVFASQEICGDGLDNDCNEKIDESCPRCRNGLLDEGEEGVDCGIVCGNKCVEYPWWLLLTLLGIIIAAVIIFLYYSMKKEGRELTWESLKEKYGSEKSE